MNLRTLIILLLAWSFTIQAQRPMEYLDRGLIALEKKGSVFLSWRMLGTDPEDVGFLIYRNGSRITIDPYTDATNYADYEGTTEDTYFIKTVIDNSVSDISDTVNVWKAQPSTEAEFKPDVPFKRIPIPDPPVLEGTEFTPGEMSVGDLDGDGKYELVFEWEPNTYFNPYVEAIDLEGNSLWRINCGPNTIGNHLSFLVYDLDEDGKAEVSLKTGPGTVDGTGAFLGTGPAADDDDQMIISRASGGHLLTDPAYITVFDGETGAELATTDYFPPIGPYVDMMETWGDDYGKRSGSIKSAVLYHKDHGPLIVFARGIYTRIGMGAYSWDGEELVPVWQFDTENEGYASYEGQGNHSVAVGDVDGDGSDELMYGACAIDHDGTGLYSTGRGHGDSHHLADHDPDHPGLEFFQPHENNTYGITMRDAATGEILWEVLDAADVGRAWAADVDPGYRGSEIVAIGFPNYDPKGNTIPTDYNAYDQPIYFDGDVERELRNGSNINSAVGGPGRILTGWYYGASTVHSTKKDANLVADILGDWREEVIFRHYDNSAFLLFSSWFGTSRKNYTLMHDPTYRMNIVVQNVGYNQPAHVGYYFAEGAPVPDIELLKYAPPDTTGSTDTTSNLVLQPVMSEKLNVYPNPAHSEMNIKLPGEVSGAMTIRVMNVAGTKVYESEIKYPTITVPVDDFPQGIHFIVVSGDKQMYRAKCVVRK